MNNLIADAERTLKAVDSAEDTIEYSSINDIIDEYIRLEKPIILEKGTNVGCADSFRWLLIVGDSFG